MAVVHSGRLGVLAPDGTVTDLDLPYTGWGAQLTADGDVVAGVAWTPTTLPVVVAVDTATGRPATAATPAARPGVGADAGGRRGAVGPRATHARPTRRRHRTPGCPTARAAVRRVRARRTDLDSPKRYSGQIAYFTSRGIGVVDVDHGGSTGYGRAYRELLRGQWGVVEVDDCEAVARWLLQQGRASAVAIRGGARAGGRCCRR